MSPDGRMLDTELRTTRLMRPVRVVSTRYRLSPCSSSSPLTAMTLLIFSVSVIASTFTTGTPRVLRDRSGRSS